MRSERVLRLLCVICLTSFCALAQEFRALISGVLRDPSGSAIPRATVSMRAVAHPLVLDLHRTDQRHAFEFESGCDWSFARPFSAPSITKIHGSPSTALTGATFGQVTLANQANGARVGDLALRLLW
jgi:hypothetical protein